ncbi:Hsp33 family molecular chaperone HslO [Sphingomonas aurantiaca]|uniref:Hsp33 family molecular chaperone HslO n=1 Tax=Sphingomonas aurantiaca TaxID=185949 RepID=UPI002FDF89EC
MTDLDRALAFAIPARSARGRIVRLGTALDEVLAAHAYPPAIEKLLAEALTLAALIGSTLKDASGQLTMQTRTDNGVVQLLVCDYRGGEVRGYIEYDADKLAEAPAEPSLFALFGAGYLAITFDMASSNERYQGIVPLDGDTLSEAAQSYFTQSEQIPTMVRTGMAKGPTVAASRAGCSYSTCPRARMAANGCTRSSIIPNGSMSPRSAIRWARTRLTDATLPLETLVWRLFNEEEDVRILADIPITRGCRCDPDYIKGVISKFPVEERRSMADETGFIVVDCAFCAKNSRFRSKTDAASHLI